MNLYRACYRNGKEEKIFYTVANSRDQARTRIECRLVLDSSAIWKFFWMQSAVPLEQGQFTHEVWKENKFNVE